MRHLLILFLLSTLVSCQPSPREIHYGQDACHYCKMTVVDQQHSAQAVTDKGKVFMFDAIECLVNYQQSQPEQAYSYLLVANYAAPGKLIPAAESHYVISPGIPSPMGANLSAFAHKAEAAQALSQHGGEAFSWKELPDALR